MAATGSWRSGFEKLSSFKMYYRDWQPAGPPAGLPIIALHGSLTQSGMWCATAESGVKSRLICPDLRGFGRSEDPGQGDAAADFANDAVWLAGALMLERYVIMGHSFAGAIALKVAALDPDRVAGAVLVDPTFINTKGATQRLDAVKARPARFSSAKEAERFILSTEEGAWPAKSLARFVQDTMMFESEGGACRVPFDTDRLVRLRSFQASSRGDYHPEKIATSVKSPVLIYRGGESKRLSADGERQICSSLRGEVKRVLFEKAGHFPNVTETASFVKHLNEFMKGIQ